MLSTWSSLITRTGYIDIYKPFYDGQEIKLIKGQSSLLWFSLTETLQTELTIGF